ncbi:unnamed protein product, partial [Polarella glacialis]
ATAFLVLSDIPEDQEESGEGSPVAAKTSFRRRASDPGESQLRMASEDSSLSSLLSLALRLPGSSFSEDNPSSASSSRPTLLQGSSFSEENASSPRPTVIASSLSFLL